jgi:hypothetical protein
MFLVVVELLIYTSTSFVLGGLVPLIVLFAFHQRHLEVVWRLSLALGAVLPLSVFYFRVKMVPNT